MPRCAKCGQSNRILSSLNKDYIALGGSLQTPGGKKACGPCRKEIAAFVRKKVSPFNLDFEQFFSHPDFSLSYFIYISISCLLFVMKKVDH